MAVAFFKGQQIGPEDINILLENDSGTPASAAEIYYALYDFTTGREVLLGAPRRAPANPERGKYYASIIVPLDANLGVYRVRWSFRETVGGPVHQAVQEFEVIDKVTLMTPYTDCELGLVRRLRIMLRDNCVGAEETVELDVDGEHMIIRMDDLWEALQNVPRP